jgi:hypothetical protein
MSLNAHLSDTPTGGTFTLEDLGLDTGLGPSVKQPLITRDQMHKGVLGIETEDSPVAIIESDMATPGPHNTTLSQDEIEAIPTWNNKIRIIKENGDKLVDMIDIQKDIENHDSVSQTKTDVIEATFESFYSSGNSKKMYTTFESRTNLAYTKKFMADKIKATTEALITEFEDLKTNGMAQMSKDMLAARDYCLTEMRDTINQAVGKIASIKDRLLQGPVILPFQDNQFIDMLSQDWMTIDLDQMLHGVPVSDDFRRDFNMVKNIWEKDAKLKSFMTGLHDLYKSNNPGCETPNNFEGLYAATILCAFGDFTNDYLYDTFVKAVDVKTEIVQSRINEIASEIESDQSKVSLISNRTTDIVDMAQDLADHQTHIKNMADFAKAASCVLVNLISLR